MYISSRSAPYLLASTTISSLRISIMILLKTLCQKTLEVSRLSLSQVEELLEKAEKAKVGEFSSPYVSAGADTPQYPHLNAHEERDGVWVCCCKHENVLQHFKGAFPFKRLACGSCSHILCSACETTAIIAPLHEHPTLTEKDRTELHFFQVCPSCGLSYRAENCSQTSMETGFVGCPRCPTQTLNPVLAAKQLASAGQNTPSVRRTGFDWSQ